jgi:hypothetical protein
MALTIKTKQMDLFSEDYIKSKSIQELLAMIEWFNKQQ